ncbi:uncharacterized protein B0I36DRAFT_359155 [Microdochium trichocladiopsis]|uniref:Uncharacterized protein n=1 Tax=Microdochium trichocladiopsis TaxID=1682393 RepID=A0A9P9BUB9_9PEZI|nr:uncharacterized protein B0I36DRAFT_359155 [Microdochium trichocladiopsis]KAH7037466.1 hypothetical protein B0I36DRAFT_359155 [Microdochium trichocladiopsis]
MRQQQHGMIDLGAIGVNMLPLHGAEDQRQRQYQQSHSERRTLLQTPPPRTPAETPPSSSQRRLRRTSRFTATPSPTPEEEPPRSSPGVVVSLDPRGRYVLARDDQLKSSGAEQPKPPPRTSSQYHRLSKAAGSRSGQAGLHPALRISKHTHSAILFTLEEALRGPTDFTPDYVEEFSQMADLLASSSANGNGATPPRPTAAIRPVGSPSGIRGPRMIMQERAAREARQREERELKEREREYSEREARLQAEAIRREEERQATAAATTATGVGAGQTSHASNVGADPASTHRRNQSSSTRPRVDNNPRPSTTARPSGNTQAQSGQRMEPSTTIPAQPIPSAPVPSQGNISSSEAQSVGNAASRPRNSFPHAFERWETLSAHWEGLTSFWIRRLEQNMQDIPDDQVTKQLARQVTDLSSAGANLFHAVVELQRLRASSERKFQRWFFETRAELERNQEVTAMLETALEEERRSRAEAIQEAVKNEQGSEKLLKTIAEMRKELTISKEEARRAWEELGRREQEERDRTASLQQGYPTIVGGVQVVPMTQSLGRGASQRDPQVYGRSDVEGSPARSTATRPEYSQAPAVQPVTSAASSATYQAPGSGVQRQQSYASTATYSDGEYIIDAQGQFVRDAQGFKIPFRSVHSEGSDAGAEDFETPATQPGVYQPTGNLPPPQQTQQQQQSQQQAPQQGQGPDYSGDGFSAPGWESMPRHHHPTRLSDVLEEEEERSRTSASQSQVSRG